MPSWQLKLLEDEGFTDWLLGQFTAQQYAHLFHMDYFYEKIPTLYNKYLIAKKPAPFLTVDLREEKVQPHDIDFINLNDIKSAPDTIPTAEYHVKIVEAEVRENQAKDGYYVNYRVVVQSGDYAGASAFGMWSLKETAAWKLKRDFKAIGYAPADGKPHLSDLLGFEGICKIKEEPRFVGGKPSTDPDDKRNAVDRWVAALS